MNEIKCKCGKSKMNFRHLTVEDLPEGYEGDCCKILKEVEKKVQAAEKADPAPKVAPAPAPAPSASRRQSQKNKKAEAPAAAPAAPEAPAEPAKE